MSVEIRRAVAADLKYICEADPIAERDERRHDYVSGAIRGEMARQVRVLLVDEELVGFAVVGEFFGHPFLERIATHAAHRRLGVAQALLANLEVEFLAHPGGDRLFVSTNESNDPMRTLLVKRGYKVSGVVENLDPGDPELFFVKFKADLDLDLL
jgi:ribosomal protein S18 acetylase RimI-like enzyme